jgi:putative transposase
MHPPMTAVRNLYTSLLILLTQATDRELARMVRYLKEENRVLRARLPDRINVTRKERNRLLRFGRDLGSAIQEIVTIVSPGTFLRWIREEKKTGTQQSSTRGRRRTAEEIRNLILLMASENSWGYTRIMGEIKKLGIKPPSRNTVKKILKAAGFDPGPRRGEGTWDEFLSRHAATLVQCDFLSKKVVTPTGFRELYLLVFLHVQTRRAYITPATAQPNEAWVRQQTQEFLRHAKENELPVKRLFHDRDTKFTKAVDQDLKLAGIKVQKTAFRAPNTNAFVERFIQSIEQECLDHFLVIGAQHLNHLVTSWLEYYHTERPHQAKENELLVPQRGQPKKRRRVPVAVDLPKLQNVQCRERLGGLLKHYYRKAA